MERQCRWYSNLEDVRDHQPQSVLWHLDGCERGPLIFPVGTTPRGAVTRIGTVEELLEAMQQALVAEVSLRRSIQRCDALVIQALLTENGTTYSFRPVRDSNLPH